jgi:hypothetical protein
VCSAQGQQIVVWLWIRSTEGCGKEAILTYMVGHPGVHVGHETVHENSNSGPSMSRRDLPNIKLYRVSRRDHYDSWMMRTALKYVRFVVFTAVTMKNCVAWDVTPCGCCKNWRFRKLNASIITVTKISEIGTLAVTSNRIFLCSVCQLLVTANVVPSSPILVIMMMEAPSSAETSGITRATRRNIPEDSILH